MLQYKIPQNVQREDQILSFLTLRQLGILAAGGAVAYMFYLTLAPTFYISIWGPFVFFPLIIAICIAFVSVNGVSFTKWVLLFLEFTMNPRKRVWNNKYLAEHQIQALIIRTPPKTTEAVKQRSQIQEPLKSKTLAELVREIDIQKATYKPTSALTPNGSTTLFEEEDASALQNINALAKEQKENGFFAQVIQGQKEEIIQSGGASFQYMNKPNLELPKNSQDILEDMQKKVGAVRPVGQTSENPGLEENIRQL